MCNVAMRMAPVCTPNDRAAVHYTRFLHSSEHLPSVVLSGPVSLDLTHLLVLLNSAIRTKPLLHGTELQANVNSNTEFLAGRPNAKQLLCMCV